MKLPDFLPLKIAQSGSLPTQSRCQGLDQLIVLLPPKPRRELFNALPQGAHLQRSFQRGSQKGQGTVSSCLSNSRATTVTLSTVVEDSAFAALTWARKLVAQCHMNGAGKLGVVALGLDSPQPSLLAFAAAADAAAFALPSYKSKPAAPGKKTLTIFGAKPRLPLEATRAAALGNNIARWFTALPPNELTARSYRQAVKSLGADHGLSFEFINEAALRKRGAGAFLAVSQGNADREAGILRLRYRPRSKPALALVGKGILFDTGGTNLKPFKGMLDMHTDMQGSAVALGTIIALAVQQVPYSVDAYLAVTENRISATAYKSQDVIKASNGTTIQVIHTDAEGRMVLADTLAIAAREQPALLIDYATLTGSCVAALTSRYSGVFSNRSNADARLIRAGRESGERVWPFPMDPDYEDALSSEIADIKQCAADGSGDHILAARFLMRFVPAAIPWIHVDLSAGQHKGGLGHIASEITGFGVRYTLELLRQSESPAQLAAQLE